MQAAPDLTKLSDTEIVEYLIAAEDDKSSADLAIKKLKNEILNRLSAETAAALSAKPEPYGIVHLNIGGKNVKVDVAKKVEWLQEELEHLWNQIKSDGSDPKQYIIAEYRVSENLYKSWGDNLKSHFAPARVVRPGNTSLKITEEKE